MILTGFVKIDRKITSWRWYHDNNTFRLFFHLILTANYEDKAFENIVVKRGQRVASYSTLSTETGLSVQNIRTALNHLKSTGEITVNQHGKFSVFSVNNYNTYQNINTISNTPPTNDQQAANNHLISTEKVTVDQHSEYSLNSVNNYNAYQDINTISNTQLTENQQATNNNERKIKKDKNDKKEKKEKKEKKDTVSPSCSVGLSENDFSQLYSDYGKEIIDKYCEKIRKWQEKNGKTVSDPAELIHKWLVQDDVPKLSDADKYSICVNNF